MEDRALVVLSGGQDSTTALFWAKKRFESVSAVSFNYGQRHNVELLCAEKIADIASVPHEIVNASFINALASSALTRPGVDIETLPGQLPNTFVPGRNLFFLSMAAVYAFQRGIRNLVAGVCMTDYSGYPDCRQDFVQSLEETLRLAMGFDFQIYTPLMFMTKAEEVKMAVGLGPRCMEALANSHTCYEGTFPPCGKCPACVLRDKGFTQAGVPDPLIVRASK